MENYNSFTVNDTRSINEVLLIRYQQALREQEELERRQEEIRQKEQYEQEQYEQQVQQEMNQIEQEKEQLTTEIQQTEQFMEAIINAKFACECASVSTTSHGLKNSPLENKLTGSVHSMYPSCQKEMQDYVPLAVAVNVIKETHPEMMQKINVEAMGLNSPSDYTKVIKSTLHDNAMKENTDIIKAEYTTKGYGDITRGVTVSDVVKAMDSVEGLYMSRGLDIHSYSNVNETVAMCLLELSSAGNEYDEAEYHANKASKGVFLVPENTVYPISFLVADKSSLTYDSAVSIGKAIELHEAGVKSTDEQLIKQQFPEYSTTELKGMVTALQMLEENGIGERAINTAVEHLHNDNIFVYEADKSAIGISQLQIESYKNVLQTYRAEAEIDTRPKAATIDRGLANRDPEHYVAPSQTTILSAEDTVEFKSDAVSVEDVITKYNQRESLAPSTIQRAEEETGRDLDNDGDVADKSADEEKSSKKKSDTGLGLD